MAVSPAEAPVVAAEAPVVAVVTPVEGGSSTGPVSPTPVEAQPATAVESQPPAEDLESVRGVWPAVVELVRGEHALLGALIAEAQPVATDGEDLTLAFAATAQFLKKKAEDPANRLAVGEALRSITGRRWRLSYELRDELAPQDRPDAGGHSEEEWVRRFIEEFDAEEIPGEWGSAPSGGAAEGREGDVEAVTSNEKGA